MKSNEQSGNLFEGIPNVIPEELVSLLHESPNISIRRIISQGQSSPASGWYDQADNEWVMVVKGEAILAFEEEEELHMREGDYTFIPAHRKHRVTWTDDTRETVWLAVHFWAAEA